MKREPFTARQLDYIERTAGAAIVVWARALGHLAGSTSMTCTV